jgi:hypothetical protein
LLVSREFLHKVLKFFEENLGRFQAVARWHATAFGFLRLVGRRKGMERKSTEAALKKRIRSGKVTRDDVARRLAELAFGRANDCVRLVLDGEAKMETLDLSLLSEVKRNDKGAVEIRLIDRLRALEQLAQLASEGGSDLESFLKAMQGGQEET